MVTLGNTKISKLYLGSTPVDKAYLGSQQVYPNASLALSADLLSFAAAGGSQELTVAVEEGQMWALSVPVGWSASSQSGTGTATLTLTIDNNATTNIRSGVLTVNSEDLTATCELSQAAGAKSYGEISIGAYGYGMLPAGGGTVLPTLAYSQPWTWNGVNGSGGTVTSGATVAYSGSGVDADTGTVSASTKGTTESGQTTVATAMVSVSLNGKSATKEAVVFQEANDATYGSVNRGKVTLPDIPASGGVVSRGVLDADYTQTVSYTSGATRPGEITYVWEGQALADSLGTTVQNRTEVGSIALRARGEGGKFVYNRYSIYQAGNYISLLAVKASTFSYGILGAGAASISPTVNADGAWTFTFSSGATSYEAPSSVYGIFSVGVTYSLGSVQNGFTAVDASTGTLTGTARGTEIGNARTSGIVTRKVDGVWTPAAAYNAAGTKTASASKTATCTQDANVLTWNDPVISRTTPVSIAAAGGTNNVASGLTYSQSGSYTSGSPASASSGGSLSYAVQTAKTGFSLSGSTVTATNNTGTSARNGFVVRITLTLNGKTATKDITYNQSAGSYTYANPVVSVTCADVPASGGSITSGTVTYSQTYGWNGATSGAGTLTSGGTVTWSGGASNIASLGTTIKARTEVGTLTATVTMNDKRGSGSATVYQQANSFRDDSMKLHFGSFTGANTITVGAGSSSTAVYLEVTRLYTSGVYQPGHNVTAGGSYSVSGTGFSANGSNVIADSRGTTAGAARSGTVYGFYATLTTTGTITQAENKVTNSNYNPRITVYGTPSVSIGSGITAAGGSATVSHSVSNTQTYNVMYSSGVPGPDQTRSVAGTTTIVMTGNGNNRFSLSGNTISHSSMGTNLTTDTVTVTATNSSQTSKTASASKSVTNGRTVTGTTGGVTTHGNVTAGTISNKTIPASGGSATATAGNGSQTWSKTATVTSYKYDSGATSSATTENASSGTNTISPSVGSITASAASKGTTVSGTTTVKSQAVTWSGNGGKSTSGTMYVYQAANAVVSYADISYNQFSYNRTIPYGGGTASPAGDITYKKSYSSGAKGPEEHGLPPGHSQYYVWTNSKPSWGDINSSTGVVTASANGNYSTRSASITVQITYNGSAIGVEATTTVTQAAYVKPTISLTFSYNQTGGTFVIYASQAVKDQLSIDYTYNDGGGMGGDGSITMGVNQTQVSGYAGGPDYPIAGITMVNFDSSGRLDTGNAIYTWTPV